MLPPYSKPNLLFAIIQIQRILLKHRLAQHQIILSKDLLNIKNGIIFIVVHDQILQVQTNRGVIEAKRELFFIVPIFILFL